MRFVLLMGSMCSLVVSVLDSPAVRPRSNPGSGSALLMSEQSQAVYYISSCHMLIDKALSSDDQTVTGSRLTVYIVNVMRSPVIERLMFFFVFFSRLTGSTQACHS